MLAKNNQGRVLLKVDVVLVLLVGAAIGALYVFRDTARVVAVRRGEVEDAVTGSVTIDADGKIKELKSEAPGKVVDVHKIKDGAKFAKGDPLVILDTTDLQRAKEEFERKYKADKERQRIQNLFNTDVDDAKRTWENARRLQELNDVTAEQVRAAEKAYNAANTAAELRKFNEQNDDDNYKATVKEMDLTLGKMTIRAPSDGEIHEPLTWEGALIGAGTPVAQFFSNDRVVAARISEEDFGRVKVGQKARLRLLTYGGETFEATVLNLFPVADSSQRFRVFLKVEVDHERLKPGSTGEVTITIDKRDQQQTIPRRALINGNQVLVVKKGVIEPRNVEVGFKALNAVEIRGGLQDGELVIVENLEQFRPGQRVNVDVITY